MSLAAISDFLTAMPKKRLPILLILLGISFVSYYFFPDESGSNESTVTTKSTLGTSSTIMAHPACVKLEKALKSHCTQLGELRLQAYDYTDEALLEKYRTASRNPSYSFAPKTGACLWKIQQIGEEDTFDIFEAGVTFYETKDDALTAIKQYTDEGDYRDGHNFYEASFVGDNAFETKGEDEKTDASGNKVRVARVLHEKQIENYIVKVWREYKVGDDKTCTAEKAKELYDTL